MKSLNARIHYADHLGNHETPIQFDWEDISWETKTAGPPAPKDQSIIMALVFVMALFVGLMCHH